MRGCGLTLCTATRTLPHIMHHNLRTPADAAAMRNRRRTLSRHSGCSSRNFSNASSFCGRARRQRG